MNNYLRCYAEVSLSAIGHNIREVRKQISPETKLLIVIKADAYGHGAVKVARFMEDQADYFGVATIDEAVSLREGGIRHPILILGYTSPSQYPELVTYDIAQTIYSMDTARKLNEEAKRQGRKARVHVAVDTGMTRIGFQVTEEDADEIRAVSLLSEINLEGLYTHFSRADEMDKSYSLIQAQKYRKMLDMLEKRGVQIPLKHICNSAGIMEFKDYRYDMVRCGIVTYGIYPSEEVQKSQLDLKPALQWKAHVIHVKDVPKGVGVSYGATYVTDKPMTKIATISVGYADGYPRALSSIGRVLIHGQYAPILGRICMDQMMVDVTEISDVQVEDVVTLVGMDGDKIIPIEEIADPSSRFNYEMLCNIGQRVPRVYPGSLEE
ncbi:alanine racemase [Blautia liquoris]|uniref:Alanine racemase n=1 Tax=Blautia liquoris TaxID=2779518 RepID=A0A7M2RGF9_9FIRM|nr:alanine racemase [Blautia liquoris]QOV19094.1 alanine racemase [Blautia liquoris]